MLSAISASRTLSAQQPKRRQSIQYDNGRFIRNPTRTVVRREGRFVPYSVDPRAHWLSGQPLQTPARGSRSSSWLPLHRSSHQHRGGVD